MKAVVRVALLMVFPALFCVGCTVEDQDAGVKTGTGGPATKGEESGRLSGTILIDGSSTVFPISQAVAEEFQKVHPRVKVVVGTSGTGGGFKKFVLGETDINDASRPIKGKEIDACKKNGVEYIELKIGIDGLSVIVHPENDWCDALTVEQLKAIWQPKSTVTKWKDVDPNFPEEKIKLFGPDTDSGTFDYFTEVICGEDGASRADYTPSADDNVLVRGVAGDKYSLGYFGYAYYVENKDKLKIVAVAPGSDKSAAVAPTDETIEAGRYVPLSRPLFLYVSKKALHRPEVAAFLRYYLDQGQALVSDVGYVRLSEKALAETRKRLEEARP